MTSRRYVIVLILVAGVFLAIPTGARAIPPGQAGQTADRIAVRINGNVIVMQSQVNRLAAFQTMTQDRPDSQDRLIQEVIDQWIVESEATEMRFPQPTQGLVDVKVARLVGRFASPQAYSEKLRTVGLSDEEVRQLFTREIFAENYIDHKFRPSIQIGQAAIESYYQKVWLPGLARENESAVKLSEAEDQIREVLTQQEITDRAAKWISDTKSHLKIELLGATQ